MECFRSGERRWRISLVAAVAAVIFITAVIPTGDAVARTGPGGVPLDLWLHALAYCVLELSILSALATAADPPASAPTASVAVVAYGALLEGVQLFLPYRSASGVDVLADAFGVAVALAVWVLFDRLG